MKKDIHTGRYDLNSNESDSVALETQPKPNAFVQPPAPANQTQQQPAASGRKKRSLLPRRH